MRLLILLSLFLFSNLYSDFLLPSQEKREEIQKKVKKNIKYLWEHQYVSFKYDHNYDISSCVGECKYRDEYHSDAIVFGLPIRFPQGDYNYGVNLEIGLHDLWGGRNGTYDDMISFNIEGMYEKKIFEVGFRRFYIGVNAGLETTTEGKIYNTETEYDKIQYTTYVIEPKIMINILSANLVLGYKFTGEYNSLTFALELALGNW